MNFGLPVEFVASLSVSPLVSGFSQGMERIAGKPWTAFRVAVGQDENTQWVRVAVFGERAQELAGSLHKDNARSTLRGG